MANDWAEITSTPLPPRRPRSNAGCLVVALLVIGVLGIVGSISMGSISGLILWSIATLAGAIYFAVRLAITGQYR